MQRILTTLYIGYLFFIILLVFFGRKKPTQRFSWILVLIFLPVVGLVFYLLLGSETYWDHKRARIRKRHRYLFDELDRVFRIKEPAERVMSEVQSFHEKYARSDVTTNNEVEIYTNGLPKFERLFRDLQMAKDH